MVDEVEVQKFYEVALLLVEEAGKVVRQAIEDRDKKISEKSSPVDLVTETDKAVEKLIVQGLKSNFPDHEFIGEEDISDGSGQVSSFLEKPTWIIDPIDGTMNFVHSNPLVTISVALAINRRLVLGIISAPCIGKLYAARKNHGATLNGKPIKVSNCEKLNLAQCILEFWSCSGKDHEEKQLYNAKQLISKVHSLRSIGSACLNLAFIAAGNSDIYCQAGIHCWDVAAGAVIVSEAGGIVLDPSGKEFDIMSRRILVASTQKLVDEWKNQIDYQTPKFERDFAEICPM